MKFTREFLQDTNQDENDVLNEICDTSRWSNYYERVFRFNGKLYSAPYSVGADESQDESPYEENDENEIECDEVFALQVTKTIYKKTK